MKFRNISGVDRAVPELNRVVKADEVVTVPDKRADGYAGQTKIWRAETSSKSKDKE